MKKIFLLIMFLLLSKNSFAYLGLGPLLPLIGSAFWAIITLFLLLLGIIIYPFKLFLNKLKKSRNKKRKFDK
tara:strand:+ start:324 stop:539 length:216 start_codon:yes stop_codon:yes gene_type:complete